LCPYEFSVLPPEILGNVYEQFLGSVITISGAHRADVVPKPEVKKAGGVYYTPSYIVDYIVKNTVGQLLGGPSCHCEEDTNGGRQSLAPTPAVGVPEHPKRKPLTPRQVANLRILDPACGSGSFLLGAYTYLLNYHRDWYVDNNPQKHTKKIYQGKGGQWHLTNAEKKRILLNNIFGVDIDSQAVEVTKLSLLLKVLEGEDAQTLENQYRLFHERALPDLATNIKCGNSLIGHDFFETVVIPSAREESIKIIAAKRPQKRLAPAPVAGGSHKTTIPNDLYQKINPFDWHTEFPQIFSVKNPGFDAVIGNPPYGGTIHSETKRYLSEHYTTAEYQLDTFPLFIEKGLNLLRKDGLWSMIVPNTWALNARCPNTRKLVLKHNIERVCHFNYKVFPAATVDTEIWVICKALLTPRQTVQVEIVSADGGIKSFPTAQSAWTSIQHEIFNVCIDPMHASLWKHLIEKYPPLQLSAKVTQGCKPFQKGKGKPPQSRDVVNAKPFVSHEKQSKDWRPLLAGKLMNRYRITWNQNYWIKFGEWLAEPRLSANYDAKEKIVIRQTGDSLVSTLDCDKFIVRDNLYTILPISNISCRFLLGLINSKLLNFCYNCINPERGEALAQVKAIHLRKLPIRTIDFDNPDDVAQHDKMVKLVERMLDLHKKLSAAKIPSDKTRIQRRIATTDKQIDKLTYELYNLTAEEIKIVEEQTR